MFPKRLLHADIGNGVNLSNLKSAVKFLGNIVEKSNSDATLKTEGVLEKKKSK